MSNGVEFAIAINVEMHNNQCLTNNYMINPVLAWISYILVTYTMYQALTEMYC